MGEHLGPSSAQSPQTTMRRLGRWTAAFVPVVFVLSLLLLTSLTSYSHGTPTPLRVLRDVWQESLEGDEEIFVLLALVFWTVSWSYALASAVVLRGRASGVWLAAFVAASCFTCFGAALESTWHPYRTLGNTLLALVVTAAFAAAWWVHLRRLASREAGPAGDSPHNFT